MKDYFKKHNNIRRSLIGGVSLSLFIFVLGLFFIFICKNRCTYLLLVTTFPGAILGNLFGLNLRPGFQITSFLLFTWFIIGMLIGLVIGKISDKLNLTNKHQPTNSVLPFKNRADARRKQKRR